MRLLDYLTGLISLIALPFIAWWGINQSPQSAAMLEARLEAKALQSLRLAGIDWANVEMDGQTAILTGAAPSEDAVPEAASIVLRSSGGGGLLFGGVSQIMARVEAAAPVWPYVWRAEKTAEGRFVLSGHVPSRAVQTILMEEAAAVSLGPVINDMKLAAGAPEGNWQGIARLAIGQLAQLKSGKAELAGYALSLRGSAPDDAARAAVPATIHGVAAPFRGAAILEGVPFWSAAISDGAMVLSGLAPTETTRRALLAAAKRGFEGEIRDEMVVADTQVTDWVDTAVSGLARFTDFEAGRLAFDPVAGGFVVEGAATPGTIQLLRQDMTASAGHWRVVIMAEAAAPAEAAALRVAADPAPLRCEAGLNELLAGSEVSFEPGEARFRRESAAALDQFAALAQGCATMELLVDEDTLNQARASAIADYLEGAGARRPRLAAIGSGTAEGAQVMDFVEPQTTSRPLEFTGRERSGK